MLNSYAIATLCDLSGLIVPVPVISLPNVCTFELACTVDFDTLAAVCGFDLGDTLIDTVITS